MAKPTKEEVANHVRTTIAGFTRLRPEQVTPGLQLKSPPLAFDDNRLGFLAMSLRGYIKMFNSGSTLKVAEVRKASTVNDLAELVFKKV